MKNFDLTTMGVEMLNLHEIIEVNGGADGNVMYDIGYARDRFCNLLNKVDEKIDNIFD